MSLSPIQLQALKVLANNKSITESRDEVQPGEYAVDFTLRVSGTVKVAPDTEVAATVKMDTAEMLALLIEKVANGDITKTKAKDAMALILELQREVDTLSKADKEKLTARGYDGAEKVYKAEQVAVLGKSTRKGSVSGKVTANEPGADASKSTASRAIEDLLNL
jgi:acylphosphatase